jgi:hypothetical protein
MDEKAFGVESIMGRIRSITDEDGEERDISEMKIYFDRDRGVFRHVFKCVQCGKDLGCICFDDLDDAIIQIFEGMICDDCAFAGTADKLSLDEILPFLADENRKRIEEKFQDLKKEAISTMSTNEKLECLDEYCDEFAMGGKCE